MKGQLHHVYFLWGILALPSIPLVIAMASGSDPQDVLHPSGEYAARLIILCLMITPLSTIFKSSSIVRWLRLRRRAFGVAAFSYAVLHTFFYVVDVAAIRSLLDEFWEPSLLTGWAALAILIPLAVTSNTHSVRRLRDRWKALHRSVYIAAVLVLLHWVFVQNQIGPALANFIPLILLQSYRMYIDFWGSELTSSN